jgi:hypothetical protein
VYSPKYEIFHHILSSSLIESDKFILKPCFFPQSAFSTLYNPDSTHFFAGNSLKFDVLLKAIKNNFGKHIIISDVDLIVQEPDKLAAYLKKYERFDITYMQDNLINDTLNIGFSLIKCNEKTYTFFEKILQEIKTTGKQDQELINKHIIDADLTYTSFMLPWVIQSNMTQFGVNFYVMQMLCSNHSTYEENLLEKLLTAAFLFDLSSLRHLIPDSVWDMLIKHLKQLDPTNILLITE